MVGFFYALLCQCANSRLASEQMPTDCSSPYWRKVELTI
jgi:hypothetical protein